MPVVAVCLCVCGACEKTRMENGSALRSKGPFPMTYDELEERFPQLIQDVPCFDFLICMKEPLLHTLHLAADVPQARLVVRLLRCLMIV